MNEQKTEIFNDDDLANALWNCQTLTCFPYHHHSFTYKVAFMSDIIDAKIEDRLGWGKPFSLPSIVSTPSVRATGKTKQGNAVVVYGHVPNYFSISGNIKSSLRNLINGAGIMPQEEFQRLLDAEDDKNVFVIDYEKLKKSESDIISLDSALEHPQCFMTCRFWRLGNPRIAFSRS